MTRKRGEYSIEHLREAFEDSKTVRGCSGPAIFGAHPTGSKLLMI